MANMKNKDDTKFWKCFREIGSLIYCWWVNGTVILEDSLAVPHKLKYSLTLQFINHTPLWAFILNNEKIMLTQNLYLNIHRNYICDGQKP